MFRCNSLCNCCILQAFFQDLTKILSKSVGFLSTISLYLKLVQNSKYPIITDLLLLYTSCAIGNSSTQLSCNLLIYILRYYSSIWLVRSVYPLVCGWKLVDSFFLIPRVARNVPQYLDVNSLSLLVIKCSGVLQFAVSILITLYTISLAVIDSSISIK